MKSSAAVVFPAPRTARLLLLAALALLPGCREQEPQGTAPNARPDLLEALRQDLSTVRHPSDGGGRAWIEPSAVESRGETPEATAASPGRWTLVYEAGPLGVARGGVVFLQVAPFWGWSTPQVTNPRAPGYTRVTTEAPGVDLIADTLDQQLLGIRIDGRPLEPGEKLRIEYGAGPAGAMADRFAERESRFWFAVDGDGDGVRGLVTNSPTLDVSPGPPARLVLTLPTTARPGDSIRLTVAVVDPLGNAGVDFAGDLSLVAHRRPLLPGRTGKEVEDGDPAGDPTPAHGADTGIEVPATVRLEPGEEGSKDLALSVKREGVYTVVARGPDGLEATSNPLVASSDLPRVLWGDLHGHSNLSDGTGTPEDYFRYARDVAALDVVALTDHDHWGLQPLARHPDLWRRITAGTRRFHEPRRFVTLLGYEWTNWVHGHRHVLYFQDEGQVLSSVDPAFDTPQELWRALRGQGALTFAHHSAGGPVATNWDIPPDPDLEPVTEIVSVHGSSEAMDSPGTIYAPVAGNFVRDVLDRGYTLGFVGSGDSHDGHPGLAGLASPSAGLAGILAPELTREAVLAALRARRVYATNGPRILLLTSLDGHRMGSVLERSELSGHLVAIIVAPDPLLHIDFIRSGGVVESVPGEGRRQLRLERDFADLKSNEYLYLRAVQTDGGAAWSSPFFVR